MSIISTKRVVFFTEPNWAFGSIHSSLCKIFYPHINGEILDFFKEYSIKEIQEIDSSTDLWVTNWPALLINKYHVQPEKIAFLAHAQWDILTTQRDLPKEICQKLNRFGVISESLRTCANAFFHGHFPKPHLTRLGIHWSRFASRGQECPVSQFKRIAVMGAYESYNVFGQEIKRGNLVYETVKEINDTYNIGLEFVTFPKAHYLTMPQRYTEVDCVVMASTEEGGGLPMLEAAAAGRLCIGTDVGYYAEVPYGLHLPTEKYEFKDALKQSLLHFANPNHFSELMNLCVEAEKAALEWDWSHRRQEWFDFLTA